MQSRARVKFDYWTELPSVNWLFLKWYKKLINDLKAAVALSVFCLILCLMLYIVQSLKNAVTCTANPIITFLPYYSLLQHSRYVQFEWWVFGLNDKHNYTKMQQSIRNGFGVMWYTLEEEKQKVINQIITQSVSTISLVDYTCVTIIHIVLHPWFHNWLVS